MKKYLLKFGILIAALSPVVAIVSCSDDKDKVKVTDVVISNLIKDNFVIWGNTNEGTIGMKMSKKLPNGVEVRYNVGASVPTKDTDYKSIVPTTLSKDDKVHIKFFIKEGNKDTHKFKEEVKFTKTVSSLTTNKKYISQSDVSKLNANIFYFVGEVGSGEIGINRVNVKIKNIIVKYKKVTSDSYTTISPTNLSNGDKVDVEFSTKSGFMFPDNFDVKKITITTSLKKAINVENLIKLNYESKGSNGSKSIALKNNVILPDQVEARFFKGASTPDSNDKYKAESPNNLSTSDIIFVKFFIKDAFKKTHAYPTNFMPILWITVT